MINDRNSDSTFDYKDWILKGDEGKAQAVKQLLDSVTMSESYDVFIGYRTPEGQYITNVDFDSSTNTFTFTFNDGSTLEAVISATSGGEVIDLTPYAKTADVDSKIAAAEAKIPTKLSQLNNDADFITSAKVDEKIAGISGGESYDDTEVRQLITDEVAAREEADNEIKGLIPSIDGLATEDYVNSKVGEIEVPEAYDDTEVRNLISSETEARSAKDTELQSNIEAEGTARAQADAEIEAKIPTNLSQLTNDAGYQTASDVDARINEVVGAAPEALDTLKEIGDALNNDPNFAGTMTAELAKKVDKVDGKALSTNDYTNEEKSKLDGIEEGAQVNKIENIKVNGLGIEIGEDDKSVDIPVPTKVSDLENDSNYVAYDETNGMVLPSNMSITVQRFNPEEPARVLLCQRTYDEGATSVTELGNTGNKLTLNSSERPQVDLAGAASENVAYVSDLPIEVNFPVRTSGGSDGPEDRVYTEEEILAMFGADDVAELKDMISSGGQMYFKYGISLTGKPMYYRMPIQYAAFESNTKIKLVAIALNTRDDSPIKYEVIINLDGAIANGNSNIKVTMTPLDAEVTVPTKVSELTNDSNFITKTEVLGVADVVNYMDNGYEMQVLNKLEESYISDLGTPENVNGQPYNADTNNYQLNQPYISFAKFDDSFVFHYDLYSLNGTQNLGYLGAVYGAMKTAMDTYDSKLNALEERLAALEGAGA